MELKTRKLNQWTLPVAVVLFLAAAVIAAVLVVPDKKAEPEAACTELQAAIGTVRLASRTTSAEEYQTLLAACNDCREGAEQSGGVIANTTVVVSEETFVDTGAMEEPPGDPAVYVESETVYFEGIVLVRYVSQWGDHLTFAACYDGDGSPVVLSMDGLALEGFRESPQLYAKDSTVSEAEFLAQINGCVNALLSGEKKPAVFVQLFTESGEAALCRVGQSVGSEGAEVLLSALGSTDGTAPATDRIFLRCRVTAEGGAAVLDLLLKLNDELMVFDVDLI